MGTERSAGLLSGIAESIMTVTYQKQFLIDLAKIPVARHSQIKQVVFENE